MRPAAATVRPVSYGVVALTSLCALSIATGSLSELLSATVLLGGFHWNSSAWHYGLKCLLLSVMLLGIVLECRRSKYAKWINVGWAACPLGFLLYVIWLLRSSDRAIIAWPVPLLIFSAPLLTIFSAPLLTLSAFYISRARITPGAARKPIIMLGFFMTALIAFFLLLSLVIFWRLRHP